LVGTLVVGFVAIPAFEAKAILASTAAVLVLIGITGLGLRKRPLAAVGARDAPRTLDLSGYLRWIQIPIGKRARYIRLTQPVMNSSGVGEVVLYGRP